MSFPIPILLCIFNRPELTAQVIDTIRRQRPKKLLVVGDGPRPIQATDRERVAAARDIAAQIDWPCEIETNYSNENLGCRLRMASGLDWAFSREERLIILEDDCVPSDSFFGYCQELLERYANDPRVMMISGDNFQAAPINADSYYFSRWAHIWGWASWRRAWRFFDLTIRQWPRIRDDGALAEFVDSDIEAAYWAPIFDQVHAGAIDTWDYSWMFSCWLQNGLTVLPNLNLVRNIGFDSDATHTTNRSSPLANMAAHELQDLRHPFGVWRNRTADRFTFERCFAPTRPRETRASAIRPSWLRHFRAFRKAA